ncbi:DNA ligase I [Pelomyxa schiedti]|nr:DNA ligase I [Pelomyxa schiedti]
MNEIHKPSVNDASQQEPANPAEVAELLCPVELQPEPSDPQLVEAPSVEETSAKSLELSTTSSTSTTATTSTTTSSMQIEEQGESSMDEDDDDEEVDTEDEKKNEKKAPSTSTTTTTTKISLVTPSRTPITAPVKPVGATKKTASKKKPTVVLPYHPVTDAGWEEGQCVPYRVLAQTYANIEATPSRLTKTEYLANLFRSVLLLSPRNLIQVVYLTIGRLSPEYTGEELGVGPSILIKVIADVTGRNQAQVKAQLQTVGDIGQVAMANKQTTRMMYAPPPLTVESVFNTLKKIAGSEGSASRARKLENITKLLVACQENESRYIMRTLQGKFRIGCNVKTVVAALARAVVQTPPKSHQLGKDIILDARKVMTSAEFEARVTHTHELLANALSSLPSFDAVIPVLLGPNGVEELPVKCCITPGIPVHPMLAQPTKGISEILDRLEKLEFTCEYKYDGERAQVHMAADHSISIFSRNLENNTQKFPDLLQIAKKAVKGNVNTYVIDCEAVGWDIETKKLLPFQILSTRARKAVDLKDVKIRACIFAFDILYLNGQSLLNKPLCERREILHSSFNPSEGEFQFATYKNIQDTADIQPFFEEAIRNQCEGLMVKTLVAESHYEPDRRSYNWLKLKKDYMEGMTDSVDLVPIAAFYGLGKRTGVYGAYLLACYDPDTEQFQAMTKVATGLSDEALDTHHEFFKQHTLTGPKPYYSVAQAASTKQPDVWLDAPYYSVAQAASTKQPDVWLDAVQVWEVKGADLTISPAYSAARGLVDDSKGVSLRFPRFIRVRTDKSPEDATSAEQVAEMYSKQALCIANMNRHQPGH